MKSYFVARFDLEELTGEASGQKRFFSLSFGDPRLEIHKCMQV